MLFLRAIRGRPRWPFLLPVAVLIVGLLVTGALALVSRALYSNNENRLLGLRAREVASVLAGALPTVQTPLASAAELADATKGDARKFRTFVGPFVGTAPNHQFVSMSLWRLGAPQRGPIAVVGASPLLLTSMSSAPAFFSSAAHTSRLKVIGMLASPDRRLGYVFANPGAGGGFAAYGESALPRNRRSAIQSNSAFSDLNYALYLGASQRPQDLLLTSQSRLPLPGRHAVQIVPFGDSAFTLVLAPRRALAGTLPQRLWWIIAIVGVTLALIAAALAARLIQRRRGAEQLAVRLEQVAGENRRLYAEQRSIAQTLQHALLPETLPTVRGAEASARYEAGEQGMEVGGDWYDVLALDDHRLLLVVGDVSGRGLRAATTMASLRFAIHAFAAHEDSPAAIMTKLSKLISVNTSGQLATVLCVQVDVEARKVTVTSAGHLPPLLISGDHGEYVESEVGPPIGVAERASYTSTTVTAPRSATLLAFTDGLVERRGEHLDQGLARLRNAATVDHTTLPELLSKLVSEVRHGPSEDDTAILGLRWLD
jgi:serine phosphatase RsbU (regulator of sigma subunit)